MNFRLKTIIILSYIFIISVFFFGISFFVNYYVLDPLTKQHISFAEEGVEDLTDQNELYAQKALLFLSQNFINVYAADYSKMLSPIIKNIKYDNPEELRSNQKLRNLICQPVEYKTDLLGFNSLISSDSRLIIHPNPKIEGKYLSSWKEKFPKMWNIFSQAVKNKKASGYYNFWSSDGKNEIEQKYMSIALIPGTELFICSYVDFDVICDPVTAEFQKMEHKHSAEIKRHIEHHAEKMSASAQTVSLGLTIGLTIICTFFALWVANKITKPITRLNEAAKKMGEGDFQATIKAEGSLEINELASTFNNLGKELIVYISNLKTEVARREHFESELKIARNIQISILQQNKLHDPRDDVSLYATLYPAKNVAGDFYDFFYLDEEKRENLAVLMADVSGKGIYAAIFMAMAKTVIKNLCQENPHSPSEALRRANNLYLNSENMFVTMFLAYYNIKKGEITYANGGHHSAIHIGKNDSYKEFGVFNEPLLGLFPDNDYQIGKEQLEVGDRLFLYTDGLPEAINKKQEPFGEKRLKEELLKNIDKPLEESCSGLINTVKDFEEGARFDDITMLMLKRDK